MASKITIKHLIVFKDQQINDWFFRLSISDHKNFMLICVNPKIQNSFMMRFFDDEEKTKAFVDEVAAGKHLDE